MAAAVMLGLAGGYVWATMSAPKPHVHVPKAVNPKQLGGPDTPADRQWTAESDEKDAPVVDATTPDPARDRKAVEQSVYYAGCNEVRAAGHAPLYAGQPGYRAEMDGDGDGVACEPHRGHGS